MRDSIKDLSAFTFHNSAEASEITNITDNSIQRGHTISVISVKASTVCGRLVEVIGGIFIIVLFFAGGWIPALILAFLWAVVRYILFGE